MTAMAAYDQSSCELLSAMKRKRNMAFNNEITYSIQNRCKETKTDWNKSIEFLSKQTMFSQEEERGVMSSWLADRILSIKYPLISRFFKAEEVFLKIKSIEKKIQTISNSNHKENLEISLQAQRELLKLKYSQYDTILKNKSKRYDIFWIMARCARELKKMTSYTNPSRMLLLLLNISKVRNTEKGRVILHNFFNMKEMKPAFSRGSEWDVFVNQVKWDNVKNLSPNDSLIFSRITDVVARLPIMMDSQFALEFLEQQPSLKHADERNKMNSYILHGFLEKIYPDLFSVLVIERLWLQKRKINQYNSSRFIPKYKSKLQNIELKLKTMSSELLKLLSNTRKRESSLIWILSRYILALKVTNINFSVPELFRHVVNMSLLNNDKKPIYLQQMLDFQNNTFKINTKITDITNWHLNVHKFPTPVAKLPLLQKAMMNIIQGLCPTCGLTTSKISDDWKRSIELLEQIEKTKSKKIAETLAKWLWVSIFSRLWEHTSDLTQKSQKKMNKSLKPLQQETRPSVALNSILHLREKMPQDIGREIGMPRGIKIYKLIDDKVKLLQSNPM